MKLRVTRRLLLMHLFFFFFFLIIPALVFERMPDESPFTVTGIMFQDTIANLILLCFFYLNYYLLLPKYFFEKKYFLYVLSVILFLAVTFPLPHLIAGSLHNYGINLPNNMPQPPNGRPPLPSPHMMRGRFPDRPPLFSFSLDELRRHLYLFFTALFFSFLLKTREHLAQLKEDKLNAEISSLKAQINPHFLFNTLNSIYALSVKKDDKAADAIVHLSGLMRYVTKDANDNTIPLQKEIDYITNYVELQRARLGNTADVEYNVYGEPGNKRITPLILITYIENAFKYGVNPDVADCIIRIKLEVTEKGIQLHTFNKKVQNFNQNISTGIGLKNTYERLKYLYPQRHFLGITDNERGYSVILLIDLI